MMKNAIACRRIFCNGKPCAGRVLKAAEEYDLWGVPDENESTLEAQFENRNDGLWGVYRFKRGFGGELKRAAASNR